MAVTPKIVGALENSDGEHAILKNSMKIQEEFAKSSFCYICGGCGSTAG
jgi:hypothetical protein